MVEVNIVYFFVKCLVLVSIGFCGAVSKKLSDNIDRHIRTLRAKGNERS